MAGNVHWHTPQHNIPQTHSEEAKRRAGLALAATYVEGDFRDRLMAEATAAGGSRRASARTREIRNIGMWARNPTNQALKEMGPKTILKNIFSMDVAEVNNPVAEIFYTMLAFWRYCPMENKEGVLHYLEQAAKHAMKYDGKYFVEFLRRVIDFPRKGVIDPFNRNPNFYELANRRAARAFGAKVVLPPLALFDIDPTVFQKGNGINGSSSGVHQSRIAKTKRLKGPSTPKRTARRQFTVGATSTHQKLVETTNAKVGQEVSPLEGPRIKEILTKIAPEALTDSHHKLPENTCCFCWNWGKSCKLVDAEGQCERLHVCMQEECRTLWHRGHTIRDHKNPVS